MKISFLKFFSPSKKKKTVSKIEDTKKPAPLVKPFIGTSTYRLLFCFLLSAVIAVLIAPKLIVTKYNYRPGDISKHNIRAPQEFSAEDRQSTEKRRLQKSEAVLSAYDFNSRAEEEVEQRITSVFSAIREALKELPKKNQESFSKGKRTNFKNFLKFRSKMKTSISLKSETSKRKLKIICLTSLCPLHSERSLCPKSNCSRREAAG